MRDRQNASGTPGALAVALFTLVVASCSAQSKTSEPPADAMRSDARTSSGSGDAGGATGGTDAIAASAGDASRSGDAAPSVGREDASSGGRDGAETGEPTEARDASVTRDAAAGGDAAPAGEDAAAPLGAKRFVYAAASSGSGKVFSLNLTDGSLTDVGSGPGGTFGAFSPDGKFFLTVNFARKLQSHPVDAATGAVGARIHEQNTGESSGSPVHVTVHPSGRWVFVADYGADALSVHSLAADGRLGAAATVKVGNNAHQVRVDPSGRFVYVPCLGDNAVYQFSFNAETGALTPLAPATAAVAGGPRHLDFHPTLPIAYLLTEKASELHVMSIGAEGALTAIEKSATTDSGSGAKSSDVQVRPDGKFVYAVNRDAQEVAIFALNADGRLGARRKGATGGAETRAFEISQEGRFLITGNSGGGTVVVFELDAATGAMTKRSEKPLPSVWYVGTLAL